MNQHRAARGRPTLDNPKKQITLRLDEDVIARFTKVTQKAFAACVENADPCMDALLSQVSGLDRANQNDQWKRVKELMTDKTTTEVGLGAFDAERMCADYKMVETYFELEKPFDIETVYTNKYLDMAIKMPK